MIFQDPLSALNPVHRIGDQIVEMIQSHQDLRKKAAWERAVELLDIVGIPQPERPRQPVPARVLGRHAPARDDRHGDRQRPEVLIADEPTTALDVTVQAQILEVLQRIRRELNTAVVLITHDLGVVARVADRVQVMYAGRAVERGDVRPMFDHPTHPYTLGLLESPAGARSRAAAPDPRFAAQHAQPPIGVRVPGRAARTPSTSAPRRCPSCARSATCRRRASAPRSWPCRTPERIVTAPEVEEWLDAAAPTDEPDTPVLEVTELVKVFQVRRAKGLRVTKRLVQAVSDVSFTVGRTRRSAWWGRAARARPRSVAACCGCSSRQRGPSSSRGSSSSASSREDLRPLRKEMQIVFQDPYASLDPRAHGRRAIAEPLQIQKVPGDHRQRVAELLELVGLAPDHARRFPHEFSGGQRQRIGIARALASTPSSSCSTSRCRPSTCRSRPASSTCCRTCRTSWASRTCSSPTTCRSSATSRDTVAVMYLGKLVEIGPAEELYMTAAHPYTQALLSAVPEPDPRIEQERQRSCWRATSPARSTRRRGAGSAPAARRPRRAAPRRSRS